MKTYTMKATTTTVIDTDPANDVTGDLPLGTTVVEPIQTTEEIFIANWNEVAREESRLNCQNCGKRRKWKGDYCERCFNQLSLPTPRLPKRRPARNAACPCGSGVKFKRCHGGRP